MKIRPPTIAGTFYPADPRTLGELLDRCWADRVPTDLPPPKALIAPHAGMIYSGPIAASAYATLEPVAERVTRVILLGPSHHFGFEGFALPGVDGWQTPLGTVPLDRGALAALGTRPDVQVSDRVHAPEHCLEIHLPFLQRTLSRFALVPVAVGHVAPEAGADLLDALWGGDETLVAVSSDLSHFLSDREARVVDARATAAIEALDARATAAADACGRHPAACLVAAAARRGMHARAIDVRTSADTAGEPERVVGYGSYLFWSEGAPS